MLGARLRTDPKVVCLGCYALSPAAWAAFHVTHVVLVQRLLQEHGLSFLG